MLPTKNKPTKEQQWEQWCNETIETNPQSTQTLFIAETPIIFFVLAGYANEKSLAKLHPQKTNAIARAILFALRITYRLYPNRGTKRPTDGALFFDWEKSLAKYNDAILPLLATLQPEDPLAHTLFEEFKINDIAPFKTPSHQSGYTPLKQLFKNTNIPEPWKLQADKQMRIIVQKEMNHEQKPRRPWECALSCYVRCIQPPRDGCQNSYSIELFLSQVEFVLRSQSNDAVFVLTETQIYTAIAYCAQLKYRTLRHGLMKLVQNGKHAVETE